MNFKKALSWAAALAVLLSGILAAGGCATGNFIYSLNAATQAAGRQMQKSLTAETPLALISLGTSALENYFVDELTDYLVRSKRFHIFDRQQLEVLARERNFQLSGNVSDEQQRELGRMAGAQVVISTTVVDLGQTVRFRVRAIDIESGKIYVASSVTVEDEQANRLKREVPPRPPDRDPPGQPFITIRNNTGNTIYYINVSPTTSGEWGPDRLGSSETVANGAQINITLEAPIGSVNRYDIRLTDRAGSTYVKSNVQVSQGSVITFTAPDLELRVHDHRTASDILLAVELGAGYRRSFTDSVKAHIYMMDVSPGTSITAWTQGSLDTRVSVFTPEGMTAFLQDENMPPGGRLGDDDDSGENLNFRLTVTVPRGVSRILFAVDEVNTKTGDYIFRTR